MKFLKPLLPHVLVIISFFLITLTYFKPVLSGKTLVQSDVKQIAANAREADDYYDKYGERTYWSRSIFMGMPNYSNGAKGTKSYDYIKHLAIDRAILGWPMGLMFSYLVCFYILMQTLGINRIFSFLGSIAFAFSTYLIIIIQVGHITKSFAISYFPLAISGLILLIRQRHLLGFVTFFFGSYFAVRGGHFQMVYYLIIILTIIFLVYLITDCRRYGKEILNKWVKVTVLISFCGILVGGINLGKFLVTNQFGKQTIRGQNYLTINPDGTPKKDQKGGLDKDYINQYSYGFAESVNLFIPGFVGGSNAEDIGIDSYTYKILLKGGYPPAQARMFVKHAPTYWGDQPIVASPQYLGAVVVFLFALACVFVKERIRLWVLGVCVLAWILSLGKNISFITDLVIDYLPLYNKFRAVASIQVIIQTLVPMFAVYGLYRFISSNQKTEERLKVLKKIFLGFSFFISGILLFHNSLFDYSAPLDQNFPFPLTDAIRKDRANMMVSDSIRTFVFMGLTALSIFIHLRGKISKNILGIILVLLVSFDQVSVARKYLNDSHFKPYSKKYHEFFPNKVEKEIMKDTSLYRVMDISINPWANSRTAYFFNSIGGYSAVKLRRIQDVYEFYLSKMHPELLKACNVKYLIRRDQKSNQLIYDKLKTYGSAWFIRQLKVVDDADQEILTIGKENLKDYAVIDGSSYESIPKMPIQVDTLATLKLEDYRSNYERYRSMSKTDQFIVFSEAYYPHDWEATIDGKKVPYYRVNYFMRGVFVPKGEHDVEFIFEPNLIKQSHIVTIVFQILAIVVVAVLFILKKRKVLN